MAVLPGENGTRPGRPAEPVWSRPSRTGAPGTCSSTCPSAGSAADRRSRPSRPDSSGTSDRPSAAISNGCRRADDLLFRAGNADAVDDACRRSPVGNLLPNALYVHRTALESLDPLLRVYEGCARAYLGEIEGADLIKLHRHSGKVSYLAYPDFDADPHPALLRSIKLNLRTREISRAGALAGSLRGAGARCGRCGVRGNPRPVGPASRPRPGPGPRSA